MTTNPELITVRPFGVECGVFQSWGDAHEYFIAAFDHEIDEVPFHSAACMVADVDGARWFIMIVPPDAPVHIIAHECVHLADFVMDEVGCPTDVSNTELRAYLVESAVSDVLGVIDGWNSE